MIMIQIEVEKMIMKKKFRIEKNRTLTNCM